MSIIGARKDDWRADRPDVHPGWWIGAFIGAAVLYIVVAGFIGHLMNGNGSPFLG
jgi:hypothetical protein